MEWRKKWERNWDEIRYCSKACRSARLTSTDERLESAIIDLLGQRSRDASICPSEVARLVAGTDDEQAWRPMMEPARSAARRLVAQGEVEIVQSGRVVDPSTARGPIRIRRAR